MASYFAALFPPLRRRARRRSALSAAATERLKRLRRGGDAGDGPPAPFWNRLNPSRIAIAVVTATLLSVLLCIHLWPNRVALRLGDIAQEDIVSQRTIRFEDTAATEQLRGDALQQVGRRYEIVPDATATALEATGGVFDIAARWASAGALESAGSERKSATTPPAAAGAEKNEAETAKAKEAAAAADKAFQKRIEGAEREVRRQGTVLVSRDSIAELLRQEVPARAEARTLALELVEKYMARSITDDGDNLDFARETLAQDPVLKRLTNPKLQEVVAQVAGATLMPTRRFDAQETEREQQKAQAAIPAQMRRIAAGQSVIRAGERVTQQHLDAFAALGLQNSRLDALAVSVIVGLVCSLVTLVAIYLRRFHRAVYDDTSKLLLLSILTVLSVGGLKVGQMLLGLPFSGVHFGYLGMMCVASAGMAIALLICPSVGLLTVALLSVVSGLILNNELRFTLITLGSSLVGIISVAKLRNRNDLLSATLTLCGANAGLNVLVGLLEGDVPRELISGALWGAVSGIFALALFYTGVAVFERWFGVTTHLRLLELSDPATPILQEFRMRVPGTYAHSLMVGNLAHAAAEAIRADALLVRVAAYYHDLGKMNRPEFFIENQSGLENVHDRISPSLSALVLASHVKEGLEMGKAVGLPPRVLEVIQQHHGTQLMKFFYHRATGGNNDPTLESQFRYAGPKPQTREAAILMLADTVEAASRTLERPTPQRIADFVKRLVEDKRSDGQLDECDLTLRDLSTIQDVFTRTLSGTLHARISYPEDKKAPAAAATPPLSAPPVLTLATFPEEALSGALRATAQEGENQEPVAAEEHKGNGNGSHRTNSSGSGGEDSGSSGGNSSSGSSFAFTRGGRGRKAPGRGQ